MMVQYYHVQHLKEIDVETMQRYGIRLHNIFDDLEQVVITGGKGLSHYANKFMVLKEI